MIEAIGTRLDDAVGRHHRRDPIDTQFRSLLDDPIHLFPFEEGLSQDDRGTGVWRSGCRLKNAGSEVTGRDLTHLRVVASTSIVGQGERFTWLQSEALAEMMEQGARDTHGRRDDRIGCHEKRWHAEGNLEWAARYSKKVFILSKKPSPSASMDIPLSLANSVSSSRCLAVSLVGI